jgi:hypothetical protein
MKKVLLFTLGFVMIAGSVFMAVNGTKNYYNPSSSFMSTKQMNSMKGLEMLYTMKANQITGVLNPADVAMAKDQINNMRLFKAGFPLIWQEAGPDNIGGRCRIIIVDRNNPNTLYAAGVSGGIFKSTNAAGSWSAIDDALSTLAFQSGCQTPNGDIYFGSGENTGSFGGSGDNEGSAFPGEGIFKSVDGAKTFTQLNTTKSFTLVNAMSSDPKQNIVYAGTNTHLKYSDDGGATWKNVFSGPCRDVKVANNGNVVAYMGSKIYYSTTGTVNGSFTAATGIPGGFNRMVISISPQDPDYVYVLASQANNFGGLFRSKDGGKTFVTLVPGGSTIFNPLSGGVGGQGDYDLVVGVHPRDKNKVFMGGVQMAEWTEAKGPIEVYNGTHSDHHWFAFDTVSSPMRMYNGNDGGVYRSTNDKFNFFSAYNIGFNVTQFYGLAGNADGDIIGGTQDNGTLYISKKGTEKMRATAIYGGDGFRTEISNVNRSAFIVESYYGNIARSQNKGTGSGSILDKRVPRFKLNGTGGLEADPKGSYIQAPFNTAIKLSEVQDSIFRLFVGANECIWLVEHVINSNKNPTWFKVSQTTSVHVIESSSDGRYIFAGKSGNLVRITLPVDSNNKLYHFDTLKNLNPTQVYPGVKTDQIFGNLPSGRFITGIGVDQSNPDRVIVTFGNFGNTNYVYYSENALSAVPTWTNIQGNLPAMPVYDAEFVYDNPNMVVIGTEFGIYGTTNVKSGSVSWVEQNQGTSAGKPFPRVAAYELRQIENKPGDIGSVIIAGTHGRGIFETKTLFTGIKNADGTLPLKLHVFPNPVSDNATVQFSVTQKDNLTIRVMSMTGKVVYEKQLNSENRGTKTIKIDTDNLVNGTYIVNITGNSHKGAAKIIVQK